MTTTISLRGMAPITITNEKLLRRINFVCQSYNYHKLKNKKALIKTDELIHSWLESCLAHAEGQLGNYGKEE